MHFAPIDFNAKCMCRFYVIFSQNFIFQFHVSNILWSNLCWKCSFATKSFSHCFYLIDSQVETKWSELKAFVDYFPLQCHDVFKHLGKMARKQITQSKVQSNINRITAFIHPQMEYVLLILVLSMKTLGLMECLSFSLHSTYLTDWIINLY